MENNEAGKKRERKLLDHEGGLGTWRFHKAQLYPYHRNPRREEQEKGQKVNLNKLYLRTSLIWGKKHIFKSRKQRERLSKSTKTGQHQDISV